MFAHPLQKLRFQGAFGEKLILALTACVFLPFYPAAVLAVFAAFYILLDGRRRRAVFSFRLAAVLFSFGALALAVPLFYRNDAGFFCAALMNLYFIVALYARSLMTPALAGLVCDISCVMSLPCAAAALAEKLISHTADSSGFFYNPNLYAFAVEIVVPVCFYRFFSGRGHRPFFLAAAAANLAVLPLTGCRSAWPAVFAGLAVLFAVLKKWKPLFVLIFVSLGLSALAFARWHLTAGASGLSRLSAIRLTIWQKALSDFRRHPLFGQGLLAFYKISGNIVTPHAHNLTIDALECFGLIGTALIGIYCTFVIAGILRRIPGSAPEEKALEALMLSVASVLAVHGFTDAPHLGAQTGLLLLLLFSCREAYPPRQAGKRRTVPHETPKRKSC